MVDQPTVTRVTPWGVERFSGYIINVANVPSRIFAFSFHDCLVADVVSLDEDEAMSFLVVCFVSSEQTTGDAVAAQLLAAIAQAAR